MFFIRLKWRLQVPHWYFWYSRYVRDETEMMIELVDVHGIVEMASGFVDGQSHTVVA